MVLCNRFTVVNFTYNKRKNKVDFKICILMIYNIKDPNKKPIAMATPIATTPGTKKL